MRVLRGAAVALAVPVGLVVAPAPPSAPSAGRAPAPVTQVHQLVADTPAALGPTPGSSMDGGSATAPKSLAARARGATVQAHYAAPVRVRDGGIDIEATLDEIIARGSNTYNYLIYSRAGYRSERDWNALPAFLTAAERRAVQVHVTLTPPASTSNNASPCSADQLLPFQGDYDRWMAGLGRLAGSHANLVAVVMDDYAYSATNKPDARCRVFAPGALARWSRILQTTAGRPLPVMPVLYLHDMVGPKAIYPSIRAEAPFVVWPYTSIGEDAMPDQYRAVRSATQVKPVVYVMVYAKRFRDRTPTEATVRSEVATAKRLGAAGVVLYQQPLR
jgi:hypothetical protein